VTDDDGGDHDPHKEHLPLCHRGIQGFPLGRDHSEKSAQEKQETAIQQLGDKHIDFSFRLPNFSGSAGLLRNLFLGLIDAQVKQNFREESKFTDW